MYKEIIVCVMHMEERVYYRADYLMFVGTCPYTWESEQLIRSGNLICLLP